MTAADVATVRRIVDPEKVFLIPGIDAQGGDIDPVRNVAGDNVLINVGRAIIYADNSRTTAQAFAERVNR